MAGQAGTHAGRTCSMCTSGTRCRGGWARARPGEGLVCWPDVLTALAAAGYGGWLVIDQLSGPDGRPGDVAALRRLVTAAAAASRPAAGLAAPAAAAAPAPATEGDRG